MRHRTLVTLLLAIPFATAPAHDGDPKLRDRRPPYPGPGLRTGEPSVAGGTLPAAAPGFPSSGVTLLSWLTVGDFGAHSSANDCWGYVSPSGREYALVGLSDGTAFVDVSVPNDPRIVTVKGGPSSVWRDIKVYDHYAYAVSEGGSGIQVFDLAQIDTGTVASLGTVTAGGSTRTHNVAIDETSGFLYRCGGQSHGLRVYDLGADPVSPPFVAEWSDRYVHDAQIVTYTSGPNAGRQIAFCCAGFNGGWTLTGLTVLDVTDKSNIAVIGQYFWPAAGYSHQAWLSEDLQYLYLDDELDEPGRPTTIYTFDVSNPDVCLYLGESSNGNTAVGHNLYVRGQRIYAANYRSGLRVYDIGANPASPVEVAWFDTWPEDDLASFNGMWSNYPFLPSGIVIGSDIEKGMFVLWVGTPKVEIEPLAALPERIHPSGDAIALEILESSPGQLVPGSAKLHYDAGSGFQTVDLVARGGGRFDAVFPQLPCGRSVAYYFTARSGDGITWTEPPGGPSGHHRAQVAFGDSLFAFEDMEANPGWTVGAAGDTATSGIWVRVDPVGDGVQPEDDHTPAPGTRCWVTGQGEGGSPPGENDVDGGATTLVSRAYDLSGLADPAVGYWRWYSNGHGSAPHADVFEVEVSNGGPWVTVETVGPGGLETTGGWYFHEFAVREFVTPSPTVRVRFRASDFGAGSIVEAAIDDLEIRDLDCRTQPIVYCTAQTNSQGCTPSIGSTGTPSASSPSGFDAFAIDVLNNKSGLLFYGTSGPAALPFQGGLLCVRPPLQRTTVQGSGGNPPPNDCSGQLQIDFNARIASSVDPSLTAGRTVWSQWWSRDPQAASTTNLTDALRFTIQP